MRGVILVLSSAFALGFWSKVFAESFGCRKLYPSPNPLSATSFARTYGGTDYDWANSVQQTSDGGYIVAGGTRSFSAGLYDVFLIKTDANGNIIWTKTYGGTYDDWANSVQQTSDGGYIVAGVTGSFGAGLYDVFLIKTDANGNIIWTKTYGGTSADVAHSVQQTSDGGYIVAGGTRSFGAGNFDFFLIKTDANGNIIWAKTYGGTLNERAYSVQQTSDGGYIVAGETWSFGADSNDIFLVKTDANGNIIWAKTYGGTYWDYAFSVQQTSDGGYIVAGYTESFGGGNYDIFLVKTDANGNIIWAKTYGGTLNERAYSVQQTSDGGYIVAGVTYSFGAGGWDIFLIKTEANGDIIWAKTYGGTNLDYTHSVQQTSYGGYIVAGYTYSFGAGWYDIFLIKTDANGNIGSCSIVRSVSPRVNTVSPTVGTPSPSVSSPSFTVTSPSPTVTSPTPIVNAPCPLSDDNELGISESCHCASGLITPYKGGIKVSKSGEFEVKVYNVSGIMVKSVKGKDEVKLEISRGVYFVEVVSGGKTIREKVVIR
jgi:TolB-like protein